MAYHYNPVRFNTYDQGLSFEENVKAKAVITVDQLNAIEEALKLASADIAIGEVSVVDDPEAANAVCEFDKAQGTHFIHLAIPKGDKGDQGEQGPEGAKGADGAKGDQGEKGVGMYFASVEPAANQIAITSISPAGIKQNDFVLTAGGSLYTVTAVDGTNATVGASALASLKGADGAEGAKGDKGDKGDPGVGLTGEATAIAAIAEPASAQAQEIATKVNEVIAALQARGVCL